MTIREKEIILYPIMKRLKTKRKVPLAQRLFPNFRKKHLLQAALTHPSYRNENACPKMEDFDRLEFFGDCILNFAVCRKLYRLFPEADEGMLSRLRSILVSRKILARIARGLKLGRLIRLGRSLRQQGDYSRAKILADSFEAVIAAHYFDQGFTRTEQFILRHFEGYFDAKRLFRLDPNPKSSLQELAQKHWQKLPIYSSEVTENGVKTVVTLNRFKKSVATGRSRRESEEKAARSLVRQIRQELLRSSKRNSSGRKLRKTL